MVRWPESRLDSLSATAPGGCKKDVAEDIVKEHRAGEAPMLDGVLCTPSVYSY